MVFLVPYDGSASADAALSRAVEHGRAMERDVVAVSYVPTGVEFAQRRKWIEPTDSLAVEAATQELRRKIAETTDDTELVYEEAGAGSPDDGIGDAVCQTAADVGASVLYVGLSDDADDERLRTRFGTVTGDVDYDVYVVRGA